MAVASLVLGIVSIVFATIIPGLQMVGTITGVVGIILGALARKVPEQKKMATGGLVCSIIGLILSVIFLVACAACVTTVGGLSSMYYESSLRILNLLLLAPLARG